jgi:N-acetylmuramoyl-L-alanine amidase
VALVLAVVGCSSGAETASTTTERVDEPTTTSASPTTATTTAAPATVTTLPVETAPPTEPPPADPKALVTPTGVVVTLLGADAGGWRVRTPCFEEAVVSTGTPLFGADVVLDPGHGGSETGAIGPNGLHEKEVNLTVAQGVRDRLEAVGLRVVLTRLGDYRTTLRTRAEIATALGARAFVSIHHNAAPDGPWPGPGSETYYQIASADSKRLAGLAYEELVAAFASYDITWVADRDAGAKYRPSTDGDYYGILRHSAGVPAVLSEAAFISNTPEADLLATPEFQAAEADALARAVQRFLGTPDPGSGFTEPYPRTEPAGPGGGAEGCADPALE